MECHAEPVGQAWGSRVTQISTSPSGCFTALREVEIGRGYHATHSTPHLTTSCSQCTGKLKHPTRRLQAHATTRSQPAASHQRSVTHLCATPYEHSGHHQYMVGYMAARVEVRLRYEPQSLAPLAASPRASSHVAVHASQQSIGAHAGGLHSSSARSAIGTGP